MRERENDMEMMRDRGNNIVIIGGGLGGLMSGAILAKDGYDVTIIEKNPHIGGGLQSYKRFGVTFDTGMHIFGGMQPNGNIRAICNYLGISELFNTLPLDRGNDVSVYFGNGNHYDMSFTSEGLLATTLKYFPSECQNIARYIADVENITDELDLFHFRPDRKNMFVHSDKFMMPADEFIERRIHNPELRAILASLNMLYAGERGVTPAYLHSVIASIFMEGACRVTDGYSTFADALASCIRRYGGSIITGERVVRIHAEGHHATYLSTSSGCEVHGSGFISAIPPMHTINMLDNLNGVSRSYIELLESQTPSHSAFIVNIKLKPKTIRFRNRVSFYIEDPGSAWSIEASCSDVIRFMFMTSPEDADFEWASTLNIVVPMKWESVAVWADSTVGRRAPEYYRFKQDFASKVLSKLESVMPGVCGSVEAMDVSTPLTIRDYTGVDCGAMCGYRKMHGDILSFLPVTTRVKNLYMTGQSINMHGFCGVSMTAIQTCEAIIGKDSIRQKLNDLLG